MWSGVDHTLMNEEIKALEYFLNEGCQTNLAFVEFEELKQEPTDDPGPSPLISTLCETANLGILQLFNEEDEKSMDTGHQVANIDKPVEIELSDGFEVSINSLIEHHSIHGECSQQDLDMVNEYGGSEMNEESESSSSGVNSACPSLPLCGPADKKARKGQKKPLYECGEEDFEERKNKDEKKKDFLLRIKKAGRNRDFRIRSKHFCENCLHMQKENQPVYELILKLGKTKSRKQRERKLKYFLKNLQK